MQKKLEQIRVNFQKELRGVFSIDGVKNLTVKYLGRKAGELTKILKGLKDLPAEEKRIIGSLANKIKREIMEELQSRSVLLADSSRRGGVIDLTQPGTLKQALGHLHPHTQMCRELTDIFVSMGFEIYEGSEISNEKYVFDNLNFPPDHPARESMDTFWLETGLKNPRGQDRFCLRPHLTGASVYYMQTHKPPFRFIYSGRVFRNEATDASHEHTFYQFEALIVERKFSFAEGKSFIKAIVDRIFKQDVRIRIRAGFFPFVEPGFETDIECRVCGGKGCPVCKHSGWLELMPGGPPHPNVLRAGGLDPKEWKGFYVNLGLDRLVMMKYGIDDIRYFHSGDLRFLKQF